MKYKTRHSSICLEVWSRLRLTCPRRSMKVLVIFTLFTFILIYSCVSLITTKGVLVFPGDTNGVEKVRPPENGNGAMVSEQRPPGAGHLFQPYSYEAQQQQQNLLRKTANLEKSIPPDNTLFHGDLQESALLRDAVRKDGVGSQQSEPQSPQQQYQHQGPDPIVFGGIGVAPPPALYPSSPGAAAAPVTSVSLTPLKIPYKLVHIDLKGAPPKLSYLKSVFETVKQNGGNGILLEYEDMFPFGGGGLNGTAHMFHYSREDIHDLISMAKSLDLDIIPLVQTFGHLEFILKLERFRHLREVDDYPQEICPSNKVAWNLVTALIDQVVNVHKDSEYIHIGCDEVFHIGECSRCRGKDTKELFLNHVKRVSTYIYEKYRKRSIIWDDMLRKFYVEELVASNIGNHVELMIWDYTEDVDRLISPYLWPMYGQIFPNIWIASAFKGAFGETLYTVDVHRHALNHMSWLRTLHRELPRIKNLRGLVITGWSRYDHFAVLCELLPVAIPSMILSLQLLNTQNIENASKAMYKYLKCDGTTNVNLFRLDECVWDGAELYNAMRSLHFYEEQTRLLIRQHRHDKGWLSTYNLKHNFSSPWRLMEPMQSATQYLISLKTYESSLRNSLRNFYEDHVVDEWIEQKLDPLINRLEELINDCQALSVRKSWDRRPVKMEL